MSLPTKPFSTGFISFDVYMAEAQTHLNTRVVLYETQRILRDLMAIINRDGGHRAVTFPSEIEAAEDCIETIHKIRKENEDLKAQNLKLNKEANKKLP